MASTPDPVCRFNQPASVQEYQSWFDSDGRLVKESVMRQCLFEVGVDPSCRRELWKFLFGIYPMNSTRRDQKAIDIENRANYVALAQRWEVLDKTIQIPEEEMTQAVPEYMNDSEDEEDTSSSSPDNQTEQTGDLGNADEHTSATVSEDCPKQIQTSDSKSTSDCNSGGNCSQGESTGSAVTEVEHTPHTQAAASQPQCTGSSDSGSQVETSKDCEGGVRGGEGGASEICDHINGRVSSSSSLRSQGDAPLESRRRCGCHCRQRSGSSVLDEEGQALLSILEFPSKVFATRQPVDLERSYPKAKRVILRDVLRTDRNIHYFSHMRNLRKVHRILMIFAMFHPDLGYAQGMNDILARFLVVTDSEVDSYWMFVKYMEHKREDFLEYSMMKKVALVKKLINEIDPELYLFFDDSECCDYLFCHRWLLLDFKREFPFDDALRLFEVISSHYLELNSDKARVETDKVIAREFEQDRGEMRAGRSTFNLEFTFDLFICVAILTMYSKDICKDPDAASIYGTLNGLSMKIPLNDVLSQAQYLFYKYCKLSVTRGFNVLEF